MSTNHLAVEIRGADKSFGTNHVLKRVDLEIARGEVVAIIGPSGSGKSTLLRAINHLESLDFGYIKVSGELIGVKEHRGRLHELPESKVRHQRAKIGFVSQNFNLFSNLTIIENVAEGPIAHKILSRADALVKAQQLLEQVGIGEKSSAYPRQLSGGQQQRAAIARALALDPELILFDEPTSALDPELVDEVLQVIKALAKSGKTLIIVTHEIAFARQVASKVVFLDKGQIVESGSSREVMDNPTNPRTKEFLGKVLWQSFSI